MTARPCRYCGMEVTSRNPEIDYCSLCYYSGRPQSEQFASLLATIGGTIAHTGGGCFAVVVPDPDPDYYLMATADGDGALPETPDGPWWVGRYRHDGEDEGEILADNLDGSALYDYISAYWLEEAR